MSARGPVKPIDIGFSALIAIFAWYCATHSVDFPVYHRIAAQVLRGDLELYPTELYLGGTVPSHGFRYAPIFAFLFVPFGLLSLESAALVLFILKAAAVAYICATISRRMGSSWSFRTISVVSLVVAGGYVVEEFRYGNVHLLVVALLVFAFDAVESGRDAAAGAALALAIAAKLTPVLLLVYFAWRKQFAVCVSTVVAIAFLGAVPAAFVGSETNNHLLDGFARYALQKIDEADNYSLRGVLLRNGFTSESVFWIWLGCTLAGAIVVVSALSREPRSRSGRWLEFSIVVTAALLASPHTQRRYFATLLVPVLVLLSLTPPDGHRDERLLVRLALIVTCAVGTVLPLLCGGRQLSLAYENSSPYFFGTLVLFGILIYLAAYQRDNSSDLIPADISLTQG